MSRRRAVEERLHVYHELHEIMGAMKNIALMETLKLSRVLESQRALREPIQRAAADFFGYHPQLLMRRSAEPDLIVAIGSERGFCGDFNGEVARRLHEELLRCRRPPRLVLVGSRLLRATEAFAEGAQWLDAPAMLEEVRPALARLLDALTAPAESERSATLEGLAIVHQARGENANEVRTLRPVDQFRRQHPIGAAPPRLLLPPVEFMAGLIEQYVHATLHDVFYSSLAAENHVRLAHMQAAVDRLEERMERSRLRINILRQEEITEEIEEIMLSAEMLMRHGIKSG